MRDSLPDVASSARPAVAGPLERVGMRGVDLPLVLADAGASGRSLGHALQASLDLYVDLPRADVKGIHMSRLYLLADALAAGDALDPARLGTLLDAMVDSHADCGSTRAGIVLQGRLLLRRPALATPHLAGFKGYPVRIDAEGGLDGGRTTVRFEVPYSSTCPCSAALSRQLVAAAFERRFGGAALVDAASAADWLREHASLATPHSQRSSATIGLPLDPGQPFDWLAWIDRAEAALGTPVQTAVKRADEQAFAALNGANLMYVEDAARRLRDAFAATHPGAWVDVRHAESLHAHDAFASAGPPMRRRAPPRDA